MAIALAFLLGLVVGLVLGCAVVYHNNPEVDFSKKRRWGTK